ncbi:MAG: hypothetical protein LC737_01495 [Chloroflexi bacterium]|nr:hypothetical protein [Chloroflexota bacterium]
MTTAVMTIVRSSNMKRASERQVVALNQFSNRMEAERLPDSPPIPLTETIGNYVNFPDAYKEFAWAAWRGDEWIVFADTWCRDGNENRHVLDVQLLDYLGETRHAHADAQPATN